MRRPGFGRILGVLWTLYFVQGLPFGFQMTALPILLRERGVSLAGVGLASALSLPWMLKVLWGPLVDRWSGGPLGRRRSWIVPLQGALALACAAAAFASQEDGLGPLLALVVTMNLAASTMDVAVDGLAVDLLRPEELGLGNIAQVVGFKLGMLTGGGLLVWASGWIGWRGLFGLMTVLVVAGAGLTLAWREPEVGHGLGEALRARRIFAELRSALAGRGAFWLLLVVATYKTGESMADTMFRPFLVDAGLGREQIGLWVGTWGMVFSIAGSVAGGLLASRIRLPAAIAVTAILRVLPVAGQWWLSLVEVTPARVITVTCAEQFFGGALTTAMFAFMMSRVNRRIAATHFTLLATVEVLGKLAAASVSGLVADATTYPVVFGLATAISIAFLALLVPLGRSDPPSSAL